MTTQGILSYLWGIETHSQMQSWQVREGILSYLWGIETPVEPAAHNPVFKILSYLWGIETFPDGSCLIVGDGILSYLWGIETQYDQGREEYSHRFYLTYEELKLKNGISPGIAAIKDFILPMRNWNKRWVTNEVLPAIDFILPMRNWNLCTQFQKPAVNLILSYLWGIETRYIRSKALKIKADFILPMRNWNYPSERPADSVLHGILSYLWGIETDWSRNHIFREKDFILPMRNWNTNFLENERRKSEILSYLWGIETSWSAIPDAQWRPILSYLWGIETR